VKKASADIKAVFADALEKETDEERKAYLDEACSSDTALRQKVEALLKAYAKSDNVPDTPIVSSDLTLEDMVSIEVPGAVIDRYKLLEKIGEGGFGVVWAAEQKRPVKRRVALKIIKLGMDTKQVVARFEAERQALALMDHPNIAKVLDAGATETGRPYFVMELVRGIPVIEYCDQEKCSIRERLDIFTKICNAIQHAHQKGIIHRDIKPSNILITLHDGVPVPRVIDFGIAKATQQELTEKTIYTQHNQFIGTPAYMSPEQAEMSGLDIDTRSDIYSLGVLLYELLTGTTPFTEEELRKAGYAEMTRIIREQEPPRPSTRLTQLLTKSASHRKLATRHSPLATDLDWIVMKCLEKDRTRRYETANGLALDIVRHMSNEPVIARPPTVVYQLQKAWRRNKVVYTAAAGVVIALLLGTGISMWQAWVATGARRDAEAASKREYTLRTKAEEGERRQRLMAYASDMKVAQVALEEDNFNMTVQLLSRYVPKPGEEDLRGIEWRYLWQASKGDEIHTFPHETMVSSISLSADGTRLASAALDGKIRLFGVNSHRQLRVYEGGSKHETVISVALSPNGNLLAADQQGTLRVWNADSGAPIFEHKHVRAPVGFSPDSRSLAGTTETGLRIWNTTDWTSRSLGEPLVTGYMPSLAFTPDSSRVVFSPRQKPGPSKLIVYSLTGNEAVEELAGLEMPCAISTDGSVVAAGGWGGEVCVWDLESLSVIKQFVAHNGMVRGVALAADGKTLATGGDDQVIRLWDTKTFKNTRSLKGHLSEIWNLKFSSDGRFLASASKDHSVKLWDWNAQPDTESEYSVPKDLRCRGFSESGDVLRFYDPKEWEPGFEATSTRTDHLLDLSTGQWTHVIRSDSEALAQTTSMTWLPSQDKYLFGKEDGTVVLSDGTTTQSIRVTDHPVEPLLLSPKGHYLLLNVLPKNAKPYAMLWNIGTKEVIGQYPKMSGYPIKKPAFSPDERFLAYLGDDFAVKLWQISEKREWATLQGHTWTLEGVEFSPDSRLLASFAWDSDCRLWDVEKGTEASPHLLQGSPTQVNQVIFSPDGRTVATSSDQPLSKLWSVATGQELLSFPSTRWDIPMMAAKADRLVWGGGPRPQGTAEEVTLRVTTLPSLAEIDEKIRRQSNSEMTPDMKRINALDTKQRQTERR
jgi:eukaryotic-like serine/threonine-protein kinase